MDGVTIHWAGEDRLFAIPLGRIFDLEEQCGKVGIGEIYLRLGQHRYFARDVYHTVRLGLIGGGLPAAEAKRLLDERFDTVPLVQSVEVALEVLVNLMAGIERDETRPAGDPAKPYDKGEILASFVKAGLSPDQVRAMSYADFVAICRAAGGNTVQPPTEEEFADMVARMAKDQA